MPEKRPFRNRLNDLDPREWIKFQKSWFVHDPPPRRSDVKLHPAKFPETLAQEFIEFFTKADQTVLDPMVGTGSTLIACLRSGRNGIGIELSPKYAELAARLVEEERTSQGIEHLRADVIQGDAADLHTLELPTIDYVFTSPPYWNMLHAKGADTQKQRRKIADLDVTYSEDPADLGNVEDYDEFLDRLVTIYSTLQEVLRPRAYLTIVVKNVKKGGKIYPLAWDLARQLGQIYTLKDEKIWAQDDIRLAPYGMGNAWVSNTFHHYCLQFRFESE
ncbi:MAG: DNA methyltransferase [Anaerolineales bacterium]